MANSTVVTIIEWYEILDVFSKTFNSVFRDGGKKAHLDSIGDVNSKEKTIDGAKEKWLPILLLDAIIYASQAAVAPKTTRRLFDQHRVLQNCVEQSAIMAFSKVGLRFGEKCDVDIQLSFKGAEDWETFQAIHGHSMLNCPNKSKAKFENFLSQLCINKSPDFKDLSNIIEDIVKNYIKSPQLLSANRSSLGSSTLFVSKSSHDFDSVCAKVFDSSLPHAESIDVDDFFSNSPSGQEIWNDVWNSFGDNDLTIMSEDDRHLLNSCFSNGVESFEAKAFPPMPAALSKPKPAAIAPIAGAMAVPPAAKVVKELEVFEESPKLIDSDFIMQLPRYCNTNTNSNVSTVAAPLGFNNAAYNDIYNQVKRMLNTLQDIASVEDSNHRHHYAAYQESSLAMSALPCFPEAKIYQCKNCGCTNTVDNAVPKPTAAAAAKNSLFMANKRSRTEETRLALRSFV